MSEMNSDLSRPNAGRIYDYLLGGYHNFQIDREAAEQLIKMFPSLPKAMRMQRWCLRDLAVELTEKRGFDVIIDFASGLPTQDHIHSVTPPGTTLAETLKIYQQAGSQMFFRSLDEFQELLAPWRPDRAGFVSLLEWHGYDASMLTDQERQFSGDSGGGLYGAYLVKS